MTTGSWQSQSAFGGGGFGGGGLGGGLGGADVWPQLVDGFAKAEPDGRAKCEEGAAEVRPGGIGVDKK